MTYFKPNKNLILQGILVPFKLKLAFKIPNATAAICKFLIC